MSPVHGIRIIGRIFGWLSLFLVLLMLLSGYGITQTRLFDSITFGFWRKAVAQQGHDIFGIPLLIVMVFHVSIAIWARNRKDNRKE